MRFNLRDYNRFGIEILQNNGFNVEVWDFSAVLHPSMSMAYTPPDIVSFHGLIQFNNKATMYKRLSDLSIMDFVINLVSYNYWSLDVYRALSKSATKYALFCANALPDPAIKKGWLENIFRRLVSLRHMVVWKNLYMKLPLRFFGVKPASLIFAGGEQSFNFHYPINKNTKVLNIHTLDYDLYLKEKETLCAEKPIAVFLDEFLPFHPEFMLTGERHPISPDRYYFLLNNFFNFVEEKTGLEVIVAIHPRADYKNIADYYGKHQCVKGKTIRIVRESKLVLTHCSTAINFANLFYKPTMFITCSEFDRTSVGNWIKVLSLWFGKEPVYMDRMQSIDYAKEIKVNKPCYDSYRRSFIKKCNSQDLPFWQIVANMLKNE